jgi:curli biogenesis system outer membrane secretion channel CsgG
MAGWGNRMNVRAAARKETSMRRFGRMAAIFLMLVAVLTAAPTSAFAQAKVRVAVMNFENNSTWAWWGDNLGAAAADELATQLVQSGKYTVLERRELDNILREQNLGASGAVTPATAAKVGKLLGVQLMLTGSITAFSIKRTTIGLRGIGGSYSNAESKVDARLVNVETGEVMVVATGQGNKRMGGGYFKGVSAEQTFDQGAAQEALRPAVEQVVAKLVEQSGSLTSLTPAAPEGQIVSTRNGSYYINRGAGAGVKVGQKFRVMHVADEIKDADGKLLDKVIEETGVLEVTQVLANSAICKLVSGKAAVNDAVK